MTDARPNVLWLVSEDNSPEYVGPYGDPLARTPTLDRLARDGVVYDNAYVTAPVCAPCRFSIITGMYASSCAPANHMRSRGDKPDSWEGQIPSWLRGFPAYLREAGYYCTNNAKEDYNAPIDVDDAWDESSRTAHWRNRPARAPFFAVFNYEVTHESRLHPGVAEPLPDGVDPADVRLPAYHPDLPELRADRAFYYDQNTKLDTEIARRLAELDADGLAEDTIVFYYGDHGGSTPRSKRFCYDSGLRVPLIVRVPAKWQHLWPSSPGSRVDELVNLVDLPPTVLSLAGLDIPAYMHGRAFGGAHPSEAPAHTFSFRNRMDERYDMVRTVRDKRYRYIRNYMPHLPGGQHVEFLFRQVGAQVWQREYQAGRLNDIQSSFWEDKPAEELYDLHADPDEAVNLARQPECQPVVERLRTALDEHMIRTRDNGFIPEGSALEGYDPASDHEAYPLERVMVVASVAAQRDPRNVPQLIEWLSDESEVIRYWAALGCVMLREHAALARESLISTLGDASEPVRVAAAEALCWIGATEHGQPVLQDLAVNPVHARVRLQAANALDYLGDIAHSARGTFEKAEQDELGYVRRVASHALNTTFKTRKAQRSTS